jgi:outer membrane biosynthesis protein TonB
MPVVSAVPRGDNPAASFPPSALADSISSGEVVLRFVVDATGDVVPGTVEVARASGIEFLRSALESLPSQHFSPATVHGCPVAQVVDYAFNFLQPTTTKPPGLSGPQRPDRD